MMVVNHKQNYFIFFLALGFLISGSVLADDDLNASSTELGDTVETTAARKEGQAGESSGDSCLTEVKNQGKGKYKTITSSPSISEAKINIELLEGSLKNIPKCSEQYTFALAKFNQAKIKASKSKTKADLDSDLSRVKNKKIQVSNFNEDFKKKLADNQNYINKLATQAKKDADTQLKQAKADREQALALKAEAEKATDPKEKQAKLEQAAAKLKASDDNLKLAQKNYADADQGYSALKLTSKAKEAEAAKKNSNTLLAANENARDGILSAQNTPSKDGAPSAPKPAAETAGLNGSEGTKSKQPTPTEPPTAPSGALANSQTGGGKEGALSPNPTPGAGTAGAGKADSASVTPPSAKKDDGIPDQLDSQVECESDGQIVAKGYQCKCEDWSGSGSQAAGGGKAKVKIGDRTCRVVKIDSTKKKKNDRYQGPNDRCSDAVLAKYISDNPSSFNGLTRDEAVKKIKQNSDKVAEINSTYGCNAAESELETWDTVGQVSNMAVSATAGVGAGLAVSNVQKTAQDSNGNAVEIAKEGYHQQAKALRVAAAAQYTNAAVQGFAAIRQGTIAGRQGDLIKAAEESKKDIGVTDKDDSETNYTAAGLAHSAMMGSKAGLTAEEANDDGYSAVMNSTAQANINAKKAKMKMAQSLVVAATQATQATANLVNAGQLDSLADSLNPPENKNELTPIIAGTSSAVVDAQGAPTLANAPSPGIAESAATAADKPSDTLGGGLELPPPSGAGGSAPGGLKDVAAGGSAPFVGAGTTSGGGGGGGGGPAGGGGGSPASDGDKSGTDTIASGGPSKFEGSGSGGTTAFGAAGSAGGKGHDTGMDLNGLLGSLLPKPGEEKDKQGSILDYSAKQAGRGPANDNADGSILGPNSNLFKRVSDRNIAFQQKYYK